MWKCVASESHRILVRCRRPYVQSWLTSRSKDGKDLEPIFTKFTTPLLQFVKLECKAKMGIADISLMTSASVLIDALLSDLPEVPDASALERFVIYAMLWSVCGVLEAADRAKCDKFFRTLTCTYAETRLVENTNLAGYDAGPLSSHWDT